MYIDVEGHHSGGSSLINENNFCYYRNCLYNHRYKFSFEKEQVNESQQYIVSHPELGSYPPFGSDREWGRDKHSVSIKFEQSRTFFHHSQCFKNQPND